MSGMFSNLLSILRPEPQPTATKVISITGSNDYAELPQGFFRVRAASGKESLGYNCSTFLCWSVGPTVVVGRERITLSVPREELHWGHGDGLVLRGLSALPVIPGPDVGRE